MAEFADEINSWVSGVITSIHGDQGPTEALTEGENTYVSKLGGSQGSIGTRPRLRPISTINPVLGTPQKLMHIIPFSYSPSENAAHIHSKVVISSGGELWVINGSDQWNGETYDLPTGGAPFQQDNLSHIDSAVLQNRLFITSINGEQRSLVPIPGVSGNLGYVNFGFGLDVPSIKLSVSTGGVMPADTYTVYASFYNDRTGGESNINVGYDVVVPENGKISVTINCTADQATVYRKWKIYVLRQSTMSQAYLASVVETSGAALVEQPLPLSNGAEYYINLTANQLSDLIISAPFSRENDPPPLDMMYVATYGGRLMGASKRKIYWSKLGAPDSFPPSNSEIVETGEGDEITGLYPLKDEILVIFTTGGTYALFGNDPQTWTLKPIDTTVGCVGHKSVIEFDGLLAWWSPQYGPVILNGSNVEKIGLELLGRSQWDQGQSFDSNIRGGWDPHYDHLVWGIPDTQNPTLITRLIPYNYRTNSWVASVWDPIPIASMATAFNQKGEQRLWIGDTTNWLGYFDTGVRTDMIPDGTTDGTFTAGSSSITNIDDGSASFYTTGYDLKDRYVNVLTTDGEFVGRRLIESNSATGLVLASALSVTSGQTYRYAIGAPHVVVKTRWMDGQQSFMRKRWDRLYMYVVGEGQPTYAVKVGYQTNFDTRSVTSLGTVLPQATTASLDSSWDVPVTVDDGRMVQRIPMFLNGQTLRLVIDQANAEPFTIIKLLTTGRMLSDRYYG